MRRRKRTILGLGTMASLILVGGVAVEASSSSTWTLYHQHQAVVERYEATHRGQSPLPVDESEHHPDVMRP